MACYYLVISSTHLSNGHFRNIKGVFRGPLCKTAGNESPDYAEKEKAIAKALEDLKANFYCELCDKQYHKHQEFDNHINSYDHAHKQRLKELKQREFARNVASKSWKDERKQERALRRLHQLAEQRQQSDCGPRSGPKFRTTTVSANVQHQDNVTPEKDHEVELRHIPLAPGGISKDTTSRCPPELSTHREQLHSRKRPSQSVCDYSHQRTGVSFCFSRKAQLKLESSASVFSDGVEEASDREELQRQRARQTLEELWSHTLSPRQLAADSGEDEFQKEAWAQKTGQLEEKKSIGSCQSKSGAAEEPGHPVMTSPSSIDDTRLGDMTREPKLRPGPEVECNERKMRSSFSPRAGISTIGQPTEANAGQIQRQGLLQESPWLQLGSETISDSDNVRNVYDMVDGKQIRNHVSFLNVLSKDGVTMLKWPTELLLYTKSKPYISYSCNPLYFNFKHSRNKHRFKESTHAAGPDHSGVNSDVREGEGRWLSHVQSQVQNKLGVPKPKRTRSHKAKKSQNLKSKPFSELNTSCMNNAGSHTESGRAFECTRPNAPQNNKCASMKTYRLGKRKRSLKDNASNESNAAKHSLKSVISPLCTLLSKKKRQQSLILVAPNITEEFTSCSAPLALKEDYFAYHWGAGSSRRGHSATSISEKSGSCSSVSDLNSDSEGTSYRYGRHPPSSGSNYRPSMRRDSSCSQTHEHKPGWGGIRSSRRLKEEGFGSEGKDTSADVTKNPSRTSEWPSIYEPEGLRKWSRDGKREQSWQRSTSSCSNSSSTFEISSAGIQAQRGNAKRAHSRSRSRSWSRSRLHRFGIATADSGPHVTESQSVSRDRLHFFRPPSITAAETTKGIRDQTGLQSISRKRAGTPPNINATHRPVELYPGDKNFGRRKINNSLSLPLIGKFPAVKKHTRKGVNNRIKSELCNGQGGVASSTDSLGATFCPGPHPLVPANSGPFPQTPQRPKPRSEVLQTDRRLTQPNGTGELSQSPEVFSSEANIFSIYSEKIDTVLHCQDQESWKSSFDTSMNCTEESESLPERAQKCVSPPLTEQPITFTPEEIDKYRHLQLQAQQHMQQQLLVKQVKGMPETPLEESSLSPASQSNPNIMPTFQHVSLQQPGPSLQHALLHHRALAAFASSLHPHPTHQRLPHHLHPLPQPHFTPISISHMASTAVLPAHPPALLAGHPLHFIPASAFHPAHLALHPLPPGSLLPTLLAPATTASTLHLRPLLHPLFPGQELQPHSGSSS